VEGDGGEGEDYPRRATRSVVRFSRKQTVATQEGAVADIDAKLIVDRLEVVDVESDNGKGMMVPTKTVPLSLPCRKNSPE
jgi:hypothetical protein